MCTGNCWKAVYPVSKSMLCKVPSAPMYGVSTEMPCLVTQQQTILSNSMETRPGCGCEPHQNMVGCLYCCPPGLCMGGPALHRGPQNTKREECNQRTLGSPYLSWKRRKASWAQMRMRPSTGNVSRGLSASKIPLTHLVISRGE